MEKMKEGFVKKSVFAAVFLFTILTAWLLFLISKYSDPESNNAQIWSATYQIIAWFGALYGLYFARLWGGWKSIMGRANLSFALGLLAQAFGQSVFSYFFFKGIEAPYPSIADIGFFGSIPFYIYGIILLSKSSGAHLSLKLLSNKIQAFLIPLAVLLISYFMFLKDYEFDWTQPLTIFLDFGYPFGQAIYISLAIVAYFLTRNFLGGLMKKPIILFIIALFAQYIADYIFLYQISRGTYDGGLEIDYLYLVAYFIMTLSLIKLGSVFYKIKNS